MTVTTTVTITTTALRIYSKDNSHLNWGNTIAYGRWNYVFNSKLFCNTTVSYNKYEMGLDGNMEDTYTVANKVQDRYYYSSQVQLRYP